MKPGRARALCAAAVIAAGAGVAWPAAAAANAIKGVTTKDAGKHVDKDATQGAAALRHGEQVYERCAACHSIEANRAGPRHCGLFGRRAGSEPGFEGYSEAMRRSGLVWNERTLDRFLAAPTHVVPGTAMGYAGISDARERSDLIAYLREATRKGQACRAVP